MATTEVDAGEEANAGTLPGTGLTVAWLGQCGLRD
jgi:hypothetical protein